MQVGPPEDRLASLEKDPSAVLSAAQQSTYKITYEMNFGSLYPSPTASPATSAGPFLSETITVAARPPDYRWEIELSTTQPVPMSHAFAVLKGTSGFFCVDAPSAACYTLPSTYLQQALSTLNGSPLDQYRALLKDFDVTVLARQRIVGIETACFRWSPKASSTPAPQFAGLADLSIEGCFTADGVPLRMLTGTGMASFEEKATSFTTTVTDADLAVPYPVTASPFPFPTAPPLPTRLPAKTP
jgi:hypothetical protein